MSNKKKPNWFLGVCGTLLLISFLIFFITYFKNVSVGEWIAKENYSTNSEWFKQMGLFIATMFAFERFFALSISLLYNYYLSIHKKQGGGKHDN